MELWSLGFEYRETQIIGSQDAEKIPLTNMIIMMICIIKIALRLALHFTWR